MARCELVRISLRARCYPTLQQFGYLYLTRAAFASTVAVVRHLSTPLHTIRLGIHAIIPLMEYRLTQFYDYLDQVKAVSVAGRLCCREVTDSELESCHLVSFLMACSTNPSYASLMAPPVHNPVTCQGFP